MTHDKKLRAFFDGVVNVIAEQHGVPHWPNDDCFKNECVETGVAPLRLMCPMKCNWKYIFDLAEDLFRNGPEVNDGWKRGAGILDFDPDDLHDLMLGVFLGTSNPVKLFAQSDTNWINVDHTHPFWIPEKP